MQHVGGERRSTAIVAFFCVSLSSPQTTEPSNRVSITTMSPTKRRARRRQSCRCCHNATSGGAPIWYQIVVLSLRFMRGWWRTPGVMLVEAGQYVVLAVFLGLIFLRPRNVLLPDAPYDRLASIFSVLSLVMFAPSYTALIVWEGERHLLRRESAQSCTYRRVSFFIAKSLTTMLPEAVLVCVCVCLCVVVCV